MSVFFLEGGEMSHASPLDLLVQARKHFTQSEIARHVGKDVKTIRRWEKKESRCPQLLLPALKEMLHARALSGKKFNFTFIDLFAGIGGIRQGFDALGGKCIFTSEWNEFSQRTYIENFGHDHALVGDIVPVSTGEIPDHDVLLAGFPCQPFSIAGVSKKNALGRPHGFKCTAQGTLFFDVARIIADKQPNAFLLENVKNLVSHDNGNTFKMILYILQDELGYNINYKIIDAKHFLPQHRERIIIVGFKNKTGFSWDDVEIPSTKTCLGHILHKNDGTEPVLPWDEDRYFDHKNRRVNAKYTLTPRMWDYLQSYAEKHRAAGNGFGFGLTNADGIARTLSARYYKDGSEILIEQRAKRPRRLTPRECARLMGFPDTFRIPVSDTQSYRQFGNSVAVPVISAVAKAMLPYITKTGAKSNG